MTEGSGAGSTVDLDEINERVVEARYKGFSTSRGKTMQIAYSRDVPLLLWEIAELKAALEAAREQRMELFNETLTLKADLEQAQASLAKALAVVEAFKAYDRLLQAWGAQITDGNQHVGDNAELDEAYAVILEALDHADLEDLAAGGELQGA